MARVRLRSAAVHAALAALATVVALLLGEGVVRLFAPQQLIQRRPDIWQPVDSLGWTHRVNVRTTINTGERAVRFVTDEHGFRIGTGPRAKPAARILLIGDSFMEALQVEYEHTVAGLLEGQLSSHAGQPIAVHNAGTGGWSPEQYRIAAVRYLDRFELDGLVVALYLGNDVIVTARSAGFPPMSPETVTSLRWPRSLAPLELVDAVLHPISHTLEERSHLFVLAKNRSQLLRMRLGMTAAYVPAAFRRSEAHTARWDLTTDVCAEIAEAARQYGIEPLFVFLPTPYQVYPELFHPHVRAFGIDTSAVDIDQPNRLLGARFRAAALTFVDLTDSLRVRADSGARIFGDIDRHFSPEGHRAMAALVYPWVRAQVDRVQHGRTHTRETPLHP